MAVYDSNIHRRRKRRGRGMGALGYEPAQGSLADSFGARLWEWLHPGQHAAEYEVQGKPAAPTNFDDVLFAGAEEARAAAREAGAQLSSGAKLVTVALVAGAVIYALNFLSMMAKKK